MPHRVAQLWTNFKYLQRCCNKLIVMLHRIEFWRNKVAYLLWWFLMIFVIMINSPLFFQVVYCNEVCQKRQWFTHKKQCKNVTKGKTETTSESWNYVYLYPDNFVSINEFKHSYLGTFSLEQFVVSSMKQNKTCVAWKCIRMIKQFD